MSERNRPIPALVRRDGTDSLGLGLAIVALLSAFAGAVDACGLSELKDLFVSFMSGNTTSLGVAVGRGDTHRIALIASIVGLFVVGATVGTVGTVFAFLLGRYHLPGILAAIAIVLLLPIVLPKTAFFAMTFAMGMLNAAMDRAGAVSVSITYVTGTLVKLGRGLGEWMLKREAGWGWLEQAVPWVGILVGAAIASICLVQFGHATISALPVVASLLAAALWGMVLQQSKEPHTN